MSDEKQDGAKIIVDEDWKAQVAREKAEARAKERRAKTEQTSEDVDCEIPGDRSDDFPPASFTMLVSTFASQSMASLGLFPDPVTNEKRVNRPLAKHFIDMLAVLQDKTQGNLSEEESSLLDDVLHQLRMAYLSNASKSDS